MTDQNMSNCPSSEVLAAYLAGTLAGDEHAFVVEHLGTCPKCYRVFVEVTKDESAERRQSRVRFYGVTAGIAAAIVVAVFGLRVMLNRSLPVVSTPDRGTTAYWIEMYGVVPHEDGGAMQARKVFERVLRVTDKSPGAEPKLLIVREAGLPYALSLKDGTIILSADTLKLCYEGNPAESGDARLAFVLGHEIVHQKEQQLPHAAAFAAVEEQNAPPELSGEKELEADAYGLIYATMAGYNPRDVLGQGTDFIQAWVSQIPQELASRDETHPGVEERAESLRSYLQNVADDLDFFHFGVRLYQLGRYEDAIALLSKFAEKFPAREVWNNLGLCHYQLAMQALSGCDSKYVAQFYPATVLDTQSLAGQFRTATGDSCLEKKTFRDEIDLAEQSFQRAMESDPSYVPAKVNLSSALLVREQFHLADTVLKEALQQHPNDPAALNNQAVARYLSEPSEIASSLAELQRVLITSPKFAPALYNRAAWSAKAGYTADANQDWKRFLQVESRGLYADMARDTLGLRTPISRPTGEKMLSPVRLGERNRQANEILANMKETKFQLGDLNGAFYLGDSVRVLVLDDWIELVESRASEGVSRTALAAKYGVPERTLSTPSGSVELYSDFALDIEDGSIASMLHFEK